MKHRYNNLGFNCCYLHYVKQQPSTYAKQVYKDFSQPWLLKIIALRHDGVSGHGFKAYRRKQLETICNGHPIAKMQQLLEKYNALAPLITKKSNGCTGSSIS